MKARYILIPGIIIALVVTGVGLFLWQQQRVEDADNQATNSASLATPTPTPTPSSNNQPSASQTPSPVRQDVELFLVALNDTTSGPEIGCGDSLVGVVKNITTTQPLTESIKQLLAIKDERYGQSGLYNALWQSDLQLQSASIENGKASVALTGQLKLSGTCDSPRVKEQLTATITQFDSVNSAEVTINGQSLDQALSTR